MATYNFNNFQIPADGVTGGHLTGDGQQGRDFGSKISTFGALNVGNRSSVDYTKTDIQFSDAVQNPSVPNFAMMDLSSNNHNPLVVGSTVLRVRNDEFMVMGLGSRNAMSATLPAMDVMSTNLSSNPSADGTVPRNFPSEGYTPFGGRVAGPFDYRVSK